VSRSVRVVVAVVASTLGLAWAGACGGSSSDTPWPAEPDNPPPGPLGEGSPGAELADGGPGVISEEPGAPKATPSDDGGSSTTTRPGGGAPGGAPPTPGRGPL
jgi:hypothetical protein